MIIDTYKIIHIVSMEYDTIKQNKSISENQTTPRIVKRLVNRKYNVAERGFSVWFNGTVAGEAIVTGAGDETLRFWNVFSKARSQKVNGNCILNGTLEYGSV